MPDRARPFSVPRPAPGAASDLSSAPASGSASGSASGAAPRLAALAREALGEPLPVRIRAWDGSEVGPERAPVLLVRHRRALRRVLWCPGELGLARAWVAGEIDVSGDLYRTLDLLTGLLWEREQPARRRFPRLPGPEARRAAAELLALAGPWPPPPPPREEVRRRGALRHSLGRDRRAVSHHYDVGNDFYALVLGPSMVYSCAYWDETGDQAADGHAGDVPREMTLEQAQQAKMELICRKLALRPGDRLLDVGCGWGSLVLHAAREHQVHAVGITLSREQAALARKRVAEAGLTDRVEIRVQHYQETDDGPYDAIASVGMAEHVGSARYRQYAEALHRLLRDGGRLLNHQIARRPAEDESAHRTDEFIDAYVFPDGELTPLGSTVGALEEAGFEVRDVEVLREHYARTLRHWVANLEENWRDAVRLVSPGRARVWRLYMAASALAFEQGRIGINQTLAVRTGPRGEAGLPLRPRGGWLL